MNIYEKTKDNYISKIASEESNLKITGDNYRGYVELFKLGYYNEDQNKLINSCLFKYLPIGLFFSIPMIVFPPQIFIWGGMLVIYEIGNWIVHFHKIDKIQKQRKHDLIFQYPYVDTKVDILDLRNSLEEAQLLTRKTDGGLHYHYEIDLENYERNLFSKKMWETQSDLTEVNPQLVESHQKDQTSISHYMTDYFNSSDEHVITETAKKKFDETSEETIEEHMTDFFNGSNESTREEHGPRLIKKRKNN